MAASAVDEFRMQVGARLRNMLGGEDTPRRLAPAPDGLFGPDSAVWDVHADASMLAGGIRALLLQALHPPTMAGVADHSQYRSDPLGRLQRTSQFLGTVTYGSETEVDAAIARLARIHEHVRGVTPDGRPYSARDPHLLAWVHATEVDSFVETRRRFGATPLADQTADRYVAEMAEVAHRMGVEHPPTDRLELTRTLQSYVPELGVNHQTRGALKFLVLPPLPLYARGAYGVLLAGAISSLPGWARRRLLLPPLPITERLAVRPATQLVTRALGWALAPTPGAETT